MRITTLQGSIAEVAADAVIVNLFAGVTRPGGATGAVDQATGGMISRLIAREGFKGKLGETLTFYTDRLGDGPRGTSEGPIKVVVVGLGPQSEFGLEAVRRAAAAAAKAAGSTRQGRAATIVHGAGIGGLEPEAAAQALAEGTLLGTYRYRAFKSQEDPPAGLEELVVVERDPQKLRRVEAGLQRGILFAEATNAARDLVNTPPAHLTPADLAEAARRTAESAGLDCEIFDEAALERLGMGALLGVARGSAAPPRLVVLRHRGGAADGPPDIALVGKGVTFDSGGLSLKTAEGMMTMKDDMAGAAAVLGALRIIGALRPAVNVLGILACVENMPSGHALRPGDVLRTCAGKTIEVHNTDAEGRLILADAVSYARAQGARAIVDVATLTGACGIALGDLYSGVVSNSDTLVERLMAAARRTGERFWRLPADEEYKEKYKSDIADIKNVGGRLGGAITGGMIIGEFAGDTPWLHLDIAPTAFVEQARHYQPKGASGVAVRTLAELVLATGA